MFVCSCPSRCKRCRSVVARSCQATRRTRRTRRTLENPGEKGASAIVFMTPDSGTRATHERSVAVGGAAGPAERVPGAAFQAPEFLSANSGAACRPQDVGQGERLDTPVRWRSLLPPPPSPEHDEEQQGGATTMTATRIGPAHPSAKTSCRGPVYVNVGRSLTERWVMSS